MAMTTDQKTDAYRFFAIAFNAAPGATYMSQLFDAYTAGMTTLQIVNVYTTKPEFTATYPVFLSDTDFATKLVNNIVKASASTANKAQAVTDIVGYLAIAGNTRGGAIYTIFNNLANKAVTDPDWGATAKQMNNQVTVSQYYTETLVGNSTTLSVLQGVITNVTDTTDVSTSAAIEAAIGGAGGVGQTLTLTVNVDSGSAFTGGTGNDKFIAAYSATGTANTLGALDVLDGGLGSDTLEITNDTGAYTLAAAKLTSIESITARGAAAVTLTTTGANITGLTSVAVTQSTAATVTAGSGADVAVSGATGAVTVDGGKSITVTDATTGNHILVGATTVNAGTVTVTDTVVGAANIKVDGGTNVSVAATGSSGGANWIEVGTGGAATDLPSGTITVTSAHKAVANTDVALSAIKVNGGSTVSITQSSDTSTAATDTATGATLTQGAVTVVDGNATTSVTIKQAASVAMTKAVAAVAGVTETASVKFGALKAGDVLIMGGANGDATLDAGELQITAVVDMTAAEVAAAFSNLVNGTVPVTGDSQGSAAASKAVFKGVTTGLAGWTSGAVSTDTVVFTSTTSSSNVTDLKQKLTGTGTAPIITATDGSAATGAVAGVLGVITGAVTVDENATASITTVSLDGYDVTKLGSTTAMSKLTALSLANSGGATAGATNAAVDVYLGTSTTLGLTVNKVKGAVNIDKTSASVTSLNLTTAGSSSSFALTAAGVKNLTIAGTTSATLSTGTFAALETITVTGSAGATFDTDEADTLTAVTTTGTTGTVTAFIDGTKATYTGGAGSDVLNLATGTSLTKAIDLGAGSDTLVFGAAVTGSSATLSGGDGTDTLSMGTARADALDASAQSFYTNFERLLINDSTASATVDLSTLGFTNYVTTSGSGGTLTLNNLASNGTVVMTATATGTTIAVKDAATGTADVLNVTGQVVSADINFGTVTAANVETVNLTAFDSKLDDDSDGVNDPVELVTLVLTADKATSVNLGTSNANLALTMTGSTKVTSIDGSGMTGTLTVTSLNTTSATTIKGGSANDVLTAAIGSTADVLLGGAGDDILVSNAGLSTLTGGTGNDVFRVTAASLNVNSYSTVTDFAAGDILQMTGADSFASAKVTLGDTAVFQDYANAAINALTTANDAGWFQYGGATYVVVDKGNTTAFVNGTDVIVKLTGLVDLSTASFNDAFATIAL